MNRPAPWNDVCDLEDILPGTGVAALVEGRQVAIFRTNGGVFALDNADRAGGGANVLARGIVGDLGGEPVVASPLYKHHYNLVTGRCLEKEEASVQAWPVRVCDGRVEVAPPSPGDAARPAPRRRLVLVGNGMAGMRALEELLALAPDRYDITVFGEEARGGYNRVALSGLLSGEASFEDIVGHDAAWYERRGIRLLAGDPVVEIDRIRRVVKSRSGVECGYDRLLLATGSRPLSLDIPGQSLPGVRTFRDLADVEAMVEASGRGGRAVVIGGGLLGVEAAVGLHKRGMGVSLVHNSACLLNRQLDAEAAGLLKETLEKRGLSILTGVRTVALAGDGHVRGVVLEDGRVLDADLVVTAVGIRPNIELARKAGLHCDRGILVDDTMQTFDPRIWAIGECVQHRNATFGLVAPLWDQARVCAVHLAEFGTARYRAPLAAAQLKVTGVHVFSAGNLGDHAGSESIVLRDPARGIYKRLVLRNNRVEGAMLYGDVSDAGWYGELMRKGSDIAPLRETLLFGAPREDTTR